MTLREKVRATANKITGFLNQSQVATQAWKITLARVRCPGCFRGPLRSRLAISRYTW